jgi:hypothetical protein
MEVWAKVVRGRLIDRGAHKEICSEGQFGQQV